MDRPKKIKEEEIEKMQEVGDEISENIKNKSPLSFMSSMHVINVHATLIENMLGTSAANTSLHSEFIASKAPDAATMEEEIELIGATAVEEKQMTIFPRNGDGEPILWDYEVKGDLKGTCGFLRRVPDTKASKLKSYKKVLDGLLFIKPRQIGLVMPEGGTVGSCQRPLRAETMQGERVALANSESVPAGTEFDFQVLCLTKEVYEFALEALAYGEFSGIGQWRNSGAGRFKYEIID